jgi:iron complex transport system ATP-binding protein
MTNARQPGQNRVEFVLRTAGLSVGYRARRASRLILQNLDLSIRPGEFVCLIGPNGAGKSTLLRTIARMQPPLAGTIEVGGIAIDRLSHGDLARRIGVVLTDRILVGALSARRVVELGRYPHIGWFGGLTNRDRRVVDWAIDAVSARSFAADDIGALSDGERQRVMIARALAQQPLLLLLDEPTAFLDLPSRIELIALLVRLARDERLAIVVSSHDLELMLRTADTFWLITPELELSVGAPGNLLSNGSIERVFGAASVRALLGRDSLTDGRCVI